MNGSHIAEYDIWMDIVFWTSIISIGNVFMLREYVHEGDFQAPVVSSYQFYLRYQQHPHNTPTPGYNFSKNLQDTRDESNTQLAIRTGRKRVRRVWILQCKRTCSNTFQRTVCRCDLWWNVTENCYVVILLQTKMWENISSSLAF